MDEQTKAKFMALGRKYKIVSIVNDPKLSNDSMVEKFKDETLALFEKLIDQRVLAGQAYEANLWNEMAHERDIERITHDYHIEKRDKRLDELKALQDGLQASEGEV